MQRDLFRREQMAPVIAPRSIAVVGASERAGSLGQRTMQNLADFKGAVFPVNQRYTSLMGRACYPSLKALPEPPDVVVIAVPQEQVQATLEECGEIGSKGAVVFASGYAETGTEEGKEAQLRLAETARRYNLRIVGPNTTGYGNHELHALVGFAEFPPSVIRRSAIAIVSQSGALGLGLSQAAEHGVSISHVLSAGNSADIDIADHIAYLAEDPACRAIALTFEGLAHPARLVEAAEIASKNGKRIVACKLARSRDGIAAALRHTGSDAGKDADYDALFARTGIVRVERSETLIETAAFFAKAPPKRVASAAVISSSGGTAIMAADMAARHGILLPQPQGATLGAIRTAIPSFGAAANPCDATAQATSNPAMLARCAEAFLADDAVGALVVPWGKAYRSDFIPQLGELSRKYGKPAAIVWMSQWLEGPGSREIEENDDIALFRSMDSCFGALAAYFR